MAIGVMFIGSAIPLATFTVPAIASLSILYFSVEYNKRFALLVYAAIAVLSLLLVSDKEIALLFALLLGPYPVLKGVFESIKHRFLGLALKFAAFNIAAVFSYWLMLRVITIDSVASEFSGYVPIMLLAVLLVGNIAFFLYDAALTRLISLYIFRVRPRIQKGR